MFDYQFSADIFVDDMRKQTQLLIDGLGLRPPGPKAIVTDSPEAHATMLRLQRSFADAPTRLEIIQPANQTGHWNAVHIQQAWHRQADRPVRFHNVVLVGDVDALAEDFRRRSIPHVVDSSLSFRRLWSGIAQDRNDFYDPIYDAGLRIEILPFASFPVDAPSGPSGTDDNTGVDVVRVLSRSFLVSDLDETVRTLERTFRWSPISPIRKVEEDGVLRAVYGFVHPRSANLEVLQPLKQGTDAWEFRSKFGSGPYATTFLANGIDQWPGQLAGRGIPARRITDHFEYGQRIVIEPGPLGALRAELVANDPRDVSIQPKTS